MAHSVSSAEGGADGPERKRPRFTAESASIQRIFTCEHCGDKFTTDRGRSRHLRETKCQGDGSGASAKPFKCSYDDCFWSFARAEGRERHEREQHRDGKPICVGCGKKVRWKSRHKDTDGKVCVEKWGAKQSLKPLEPALVIPDTSHTDEEHDTCDGKCFLREAEVRKWELFDEASRLAKRRKRSMKSISFAPLLPCGLCSESISTSNPGLLFEHLGHHFNGFKFGYWCEQCKIRFALEADLRRHLSSSAFGDCGYGFTHTVPCTGHHPPQSKSVDADRFNLCYRVGSWELSQLQLHKSIIGFLANLQNEQRAVFSCPGWSTTSELRTGTPSIDGGIARSEPPITFPENDRVDVSAAGQATLGHGILRWAGTTVNDFARRKSRSGDTAEESIQAPSIMAELPEGEKDTNTRPAKAGELTMGLHKPSYLELMHIQSSFSPGQVPQERSLPPASESDPSLVWSPVLCQYAAAGATKQVQLLLSLGTDPNIYDVLGNTPLHYASRNGCVEIARSLVEHDAPLDAISQNDGYTPLIIAIRSGFVNVVKVLQESGANIDTRDQNNCTALHSACFDADVLFVELLLRHGADCDAVSDHQRRPLHIAASRSKAIVNLLLTYGADAFCLDELGETPFDIALGTGKISIIMAFLEHNPDIDCIFRAYESGASMQVILPLLLCHQEVNARDSNGTSLLHLAARMHNFNDVLDLLKAGADVNATTSTGDSPLHLALCGCCHVSERASLRLLQLLMESGADIDLANREGLTPAQMTRHLDLDLAGIVQETQG